MADSKNTIVLNISKSETGLVNDAESLVQREGQLRLRKIIEGQLLQIEDLRAKAVPKSAITANFEISYSRPHNAILIEGGRGSGKTTFLLNALDNLDQARGDFSSIGKRVRVLPLLDPTLIETKQNIIVVILSMIETAIESFAEEDADLTSARQELAEGLSLLDGIGQASAYGAEWEDASWVMSRGLDKARRGHSFERKLNVYLDKALALLRMDAFVLAFDDVDTNFSHGFTILETIRKYLTSPRLILLLSGDLELYGRLLRRNIYSTFGERVLKHDIDILEKSRPDVASTVLELEEQYLLKVLPPQNRIAMLPLGGLVARYNIVLEDSSLAENDAPLETIASWASMRIREQLLEQPKSKGTHPFFDFVSMEHMRMVIGYLRALQVGSESVSKFNVEVDSRKAVLTVFEARLRTNGLPPDIIDRGNFDYTLRVAFEWFSRQDDAPELLRFGIPAERNKAVGLHCLGLALASFLQNSPGASLRALFALGLPLAMMRRPNLSEQAMRTAMAGFLWSQSAPSTPEVAARLGAIDRLAQDVAKASASSFGSVGVVSKLARDELVKRLYNLQKPPAPPTVAGLSLALKEKHKQRWLTALMEADAGSLEFAHGVTWFSIEELTDEDRIGAFGGYLSLIVNRRFTQRGEVNRSVSALSLFATIAQILLEPDGDIPSSYVFSSIVPSLRHRDTPAGRAEQIIDGDDPSDGESQDEGNAILDEDSEFKLFQSNMIAWRDFAKRQEIGAGLSPDTIGHISLRLHDDLIALDEKVPSTWKTGEILHRQITNVIHVVVSMTSDHTGRKESPKTSDKPLIDLLSPARGLELHPLAVILLTCPLVWAYLEPSEAGQAKTNSARLHRNAREALDNWCNNRTGSREGALSDFVGFDPAWLDAPEIAVLTTSKQSREKNTIVRTKGFYDLLNVVPRYV